MPAGHMAQLDSLRAFAFAGVAWSHWAPLSYQCGLPWGTGVQLFFILSGFLITGILLEHRPEGDGPAKWHARFTVWRRFYLRRCLRIFPLYYLVLVVALVLGIDRIRETWPWHAAYLSNLHYYLLGHQGRDHFLHFWSLAVEEQFYLVWPFLVLLLPLRRLTHTLLLLVAIAPVFRIVVGLFAPDPNKADYLTIGSLDALGLGALFALRFHTARLRGARWDASRTITALFWTGLAGAIAAWAATQMLAGDLVAKSLGHLCVVMFFASIVLKASIGFSGWAGAVLEARPLRYLGKISYGLYVYHLFSDLLVARINHWLSVPPEVSSGLWYRLAAQLCITVLVASVSWHVFEKPLNELKRFFPYRGAEAGGREESVLVLEPMAAPTGPEALPSNNGTS